MNELGNHLISLKDAAFIVIFILIVIALIYLILILKRLVVTIKHTNQVLKNVESMTDMAEKRTADVDVILTSILSNIKSITSSSEGKESFIKYATNIAKGIGSLIGVIKKSKDDKASKKEKEDVKASEIIDVE
ncbi:MAG: hypothetical protein PUI85_01580 [Eubacteriales bacterium]|nr:hypothetical protein [Eubacteriales bacterium]MDY3332918.1 hypothetical protein [Gallibacter sp.]